MAADGAYERTKKAYLRKRQYLTIWYKIKRIHASMTQKIAHTIMKIAAAYRVNFIFMEDLRWTHHSSKKMVGTWLAHNQQHFFFSQINQTLEDLCVSRAVRIKKVNARWSSQIAWTLQAHHNFQIDSRTTRSSIAPYLGIRTRKTFKTLTSHPNMAWQGDADLNAARNIALRGLLRV